MEWLNYHHLLYFWLSAKKKSVTAAAKQLRLSQPTVSGQIRQLEESLGHKLLDRTGRQLELTPEGQTVYRYADEIFGLGQELLDAVRDQPVGRPLRLVAGVADALPKLIVRRLLAPALELPEPIELVVREAPGDQLLGELAIHALDLVLADSPIAPNAGVRAFNHLLGESSVAFFATPALAAKLAEGFPRSLDGAPFLFPGANTVFRRCLDHWLDDRDLRPRLVAELEDSALAKAFGQAGAGVFVAPVAIEREVAQQYDVQVFGRASDLTERYYAITVERRIKHPGVVAISRAARDWLRS